MNMGWKCPGCGRCYSPLTPQCFSCGQPTYTSNNTGLNVGAGFGGSVSAPSTVNVNGGTITIKKNIGTEFE